MSIIILIIFAIISYTLYGVFASRASGKIDVNLSTVIFNGLGAILPLIVFTFYKISKGEKLIDTTNSGIIYSVLAGVSIAVFGVLLMKIFEKGGLSYVMPLVYGGTIILTSLIGWLLFKENISGIQLFGIAFIIVGITLVIFSKI